MWHLFEIAVMGFLILVTVLLILVYKQTRGRGDDAAAHPVRDELRLAREEASQMMREFREEVTRQFELFRAAVELQLRAIQEGEERRLGEIRSVMESGLASAATATTAAGSQQREEVQATLKNTSDTVVKMMGELGASQTAQLESVRTTVGQQLKEIREGNERKLEEMRKTVDEQLQGALERRLDESFRLVGDRLEAVQRGLGEMRSLAAGVGDLKRVLGNVKARGTWAEVQLGGILEQILTPEQYSRNVQTKSESRERVEFAIRLPGPSVDDASEVWLPLDSKFPQEDYLRLLEAAEVGDAERVQECTSALARTIRTCAQEVRDKYLNPPQTTDFAILFLATEGLYAEVLRQPGLVEELQHKFRVVVAGPTTLAAILSSLRMGFRTLAIEQRASEVWGVLAAVKTEFGKFGSVLDKVKRQIDTAGKTIDDAAVRTRAMRRKLRGVEELPSETTAAVLALPMAEPADGEEEPRAQAGG